MHAPETPTTANAGQQPPAEDGFIADQDAADSAAEDDEEEGAGKPNDKKAGRRKIKIEFIQDKSRRHITFSKRKAGEWRRVHSCCMRAYIHPRSLTRWGRLPDAPFFGASSLVILFVCPALAVGGDDL
jgi:hypothetical protein